jgi:hypothetical protein
MGAVARDRFVESSKPGARMTAYPITKAVRQNVHVMVGLAGGTGAGKSFSALELATGLAGDAPIALADSDNGRALHYAPRPGEKAVRGESFEFFHTRISAPFRPDAYLECIKALEKEGFGTIIVDNISHEHAGEGGLLDWHEEILDRMAGDDWKKRDANTMRAWIEPKMSHKKFLQHLLQVKAHLIFTMRAEEKVEIARVDGKTVIRPKDGPTGAQGWLPVCEKNFPFELTASFLLKADNPGYPIPIKLEAQHRMMFGIGTPAGSLVQRPISRDTGVAIAAWANGTHKMLPPSLSSILTAIKIAETMAQLDAVKPQAGLLTGDDKAKAVDAYKAKAKEFGK